MSPYWLAAGQGELDLGLQPAAARRRELFDRLLVVDEQHLRGVLAGYLLHDSSARPHRSLGGVTAAQAHAFEPRKLSGDGRQVRQLVQPPATAGHGPRRQPENRGQQNACLLPPSEYGPAPS